MEIIMNITYILLSSDAGGSTGGYAISYIISIIVLLSLFYFFCCVPRMKEQKKRKEMFKAMEVGDVVLTTGDFYGVIIDITEEDVIVEFGSNENCRIAMRKTAIAQVLKEKQ